MIEPARAADGQPGRLVLSDHTERLAQARSRAQYEIGDMYWADMIIAAYLDPALDLEKLRKDMA
jgi:hypothetical protein